MQFISTMKQQSYTMEIARSEVIKTNVGNVVENYRSRRVVFEPLVEPLFTPNLPKGEAWGVLDTEKTARDIGVDEEAIINFLYKHKDYGIRMIGLGVNGAEIVNDEEFFQPEGQGGFYCSVCKKHIQNIQGKSNHMKSGGHLEQVEFAKKAALANVV